MSWDQVMLQPLKTFLNWLVVLVPRALGAAALLVVGWVVAVMCRQLVVRVLQTVGLDRLSEKARVHEILRRGAIRWTFAELIGQLVFWIILLALMTVALQSIGVAAATEWLERLGYFIPRLIASVAIFLFGMLLASFLGATVRAASLNAGFPQGFFIGQVIHAAVVLLTIIVALEQLQVVTRTIEVALYILLGAFGLAFALALGLGAQEFVRDFLTDVRNRWRTPPS